MINSLSFLVNLRPYFVKYSPDKLINFKLTINGSRGVVVGFGVYFVALITVGTIKLPLRGPSNVSPRFMKKMERNDKLKVIITVGVLCALLTVLLPYSVLIGDVSCTC